MRFILIAVLAINIYAHDIYMMSSDKIMLAEYIMSTCTDKEVFVWEEMKCVSYIENEWEYFKADPNAMEDDNEIGRHTN